MIKLKELLTEVKPAKVIKTVDRGMQRWGAFGGDYIYKGKTPKGHMYKQKVGYAKGKEHILYFKDYEKEVLKDKRFDVVKEKLAMGDEYVGTARLKDGTKVMLYRSNEADKWSIGKKYGIKKWDYYLLVKGKGADYIVYTGTKILRKAGKWAQGYIQRKLSGTGKERFS